MTKPTKRDRAKDILSVVRKFSGQEVRVAEIAFLLGRKNDRGFGEDLSLARHLALDVDERITECYWSEDRKCQVLVHMTAQNEDGRGIWGILRHGSDVLTRSRNLGRHAGWEERHAVRSDDRTLAGFARQMAESAELHGLMFETLKEALKDKR